MLVKLFVSILLGAISGWLAGKIMKSEGGLIRSIILGVSGGFVGELIFELLGITTSGYIGTVLVSVIGACLVIFVVNRIIKK